MAITIASRSSVARNAVLGVLQLLFALLFGALSAAGIWSLFARPEDPDRFVALPGLAMILPAFLFLGAYAGRNLHLLMLDAGIVADEERITLRIPRVPFAMAPYLVLREETVSWPEANLPFTPGKRSRLLVSSARPETAIPSGQFDESLYQIDAGLRAAVEDLRLGKAIIPPERIITGSSRTVLLIAGGVSVAVAGGAVAYFVETAPGLANLLAMPVIFGLALMAMGASPRKRVVIDKRGVFVERGRHLDYVPYQAFETARTESSHFFFRAFQSFHIDITVEGKKMRVGFNRIFGFGFDVDDVRRAFTA